jgi:hypothetical protein
MNPGGRHSAVPNYFVMFQKTVYPYILGYGRDPNRFQALEKIIQSRDLQNLWLCCPIFIQPLEVGKAVPIADFLIADGWSSVGVGLFLKRGRVKHSL